MSLSNLCYTVALDRPDEDFHRKMARLLVLSLLRTNWHGKIVVFRNGPLPALPEGHAAVEEIRLEASPEAIWHRTVSWKYRVRDQLDLTGVGKVLFLDCDCIALREINYLVAGAWDLYTAPEPLSVVDFAFNGYLRDEEMASLGDLPGLNSGAMGIRSEHYRDVMAEWERLDAIEPLRTPRHRNQHSWNRLVLDTSLRRRDFLPADVQYPLVHHTPYWNTRRAALVHAAGGSPADKLALLFGLWMDAFEVSRLDEHASLPEAADS